jgi:hypothetical protein
VGFVCDVICMAHHRWWVLFVTSFAWPISGGFVNVLVELINVLCCAVLCCVV